MKQNLTFLAILIALISGAYIIHEVGERKAKEAKESSTRLLNSDGMGEFRAFIFPSVKILSTPQGYYVDEPRVRADSTRVQAVLDRLSTLRVRRVIGDEEIADVGMSHFISPQQKVDQKLKFVFDSGELVFRIGRKIDVDRAFYVEVLRVYSGQTYDEAQRILAVVFDASVRQTAYLASEAHRDDTAYRELISLFALGKDFFYETAPILSAPRLEDLALLEIDNQRNRSFSIDYQTKVTNPEAFHGISYDSEAMEAYYYKLLKIKGTELIVAPSFDLLSDLRSQVYFRDQSQDREYSYYLFQNYADREGSFLHTISLETGERTERLVQISDEDRSLFFRNHQDFWNIHPFERELRNLRVLFHGDEKAKELSFRRSGRFEAQLVGGEQQETWTPRHQSFHKLLTFLESRPDFISKVQRASPQTTIDDAMVGVDAYRRLMRIFYEGREFDLIQTSRELVLVEFSSGEFLRYHYLTGREFPIPLLKAEYGEY